MSDTIESFAEKVHKIMSPHDTTCSYTDREWEVAKMFARLQSLCDTLAEALEHAEETLDILASGQANVDTVSKIARMYKGQFQQVLTAARFILDSSPV